MNLEEYARGVAGVPSSGIEVASPRPSTERLPQNSQESDGNKHSGWRWLDRLVRRHRETESLATTPKAREQDRSEKGERRAREQKEARDFDWNTGLQLMENYRQQYEALLQEKATNHGDDYLNDVPDLVELRNKSLRLEYKMRSLATMDERIWSKPTWIVRLELQVEAMARGETWEMATSQKGVDMTAESMNIKRLSQTPGAFYETPMELLKEYQRKQAERREQEEANRPAPQPRHRLSPDVRILTSELLSLAAANDYLRDSGEITPEEAAQATDREMASNTLPWLQPEERTRRSYPDNEQLAAVVSNNGWPEDNTDPAALEQQYVDISADELDGGELTTSPDDTPEAQEVITVTENEEDTSLVSDFGRDALLRAYQRRKMTETKTNNQRYRLSHILKKQIRDAYTQEEPDYGDDLSNENGGSIFGKQVIESGAQNQDLNQADPEINDGQSTANYLLESYLNQKNREEKVLLATNVSPQDEKVTDQEQTAQPEETVHESFSTQTKESQSDEQPKTPDVQEDPIFSTATQENEKKQLVGRAHHVLQSLLASRRAQEEEKRRQEQQQQQAQREPIVTVAPQEPNLPNDNGDRSVRGSYQKRPDDDPYNDAHDDQEDSDVSGRNKNSKNKRNKKWRLPLDRTDDSPSNDQDTTVDLSALNDNGNMGTFSDLFEGFNLKANDSQPVPVPENQEQPEAATTQEDTVAPEATLKIEQSITPEAISPNVRQQFDQKLVELIMMDNKLDKVVNFRIAVADRKSPDEYAQGLANDIVNFGRLDVSLKSALIQEIKQTPLFEQISQVYKLREAYAKWNKVGTSKEDLKSGRHGKSNEGTVYQAINMALQAADGSEELIDQIQKLKYEIDKINHESFMFSDKQAETWLEISGKLQKLRNQRLEDLTQKQDKKGKFKNEAKEVGGLWQKVQQATPEIPTPAPDN